MFFFFFVENFSVFCLYIFIQIYICKLPIVTCKIYRRYGNRKCVVLMKPKIVVAQIFYFCFLNLQCDCVV